MLRAGSAVRGLFLAVFVALATFTVALIGGFVHATRVADEAAAQNERSLLHNHIDVAIQTIFSAQKVQLTWDDAVRAAGGQSDKLDAAWADNFLGTFLWNNLHADYLFLITPDGKPLRAWKQGKPEDAAAFAAISGEISDELAEMAANKSVAGEPAGFKQLDDTLWPLDRNGMPLTRWGGELGDFRGEPAIITLATIVPDSDVSLLKRSPNVLVSVQALDHALLSRFSSDLLLSDLKLTPAFRERPGYLGMNLRSEEGKPLGWLSWRQNAVGPIVVSKTVPMLAAYLGFFVLVLGGGVILVRQSMAMTREYAEREARATRNALHDPMLGLPNRTLVLQRLDGDLAAIRSSRREDDALFLAYIDLDHFKSINDSIGHHVGDELLFKVARRLKNCLEPGDMLGRLASDEFVILHLGTGGREAGEALGKRIMAAFAEQFSVLEHKLQVTASCGIAWGPEQSDDATDLLRLADIALFRAKQRGRGRYRCFVEEMNSTIRWRQDLEVELRRAIASDGLHMVYQPIVHIGEQRITCFEALVRWDHRERGAISPGVFVPLAESCGLMPMLGDWVLRQVFRDSAALGDVELSINLSPMQITSRDFVARLEDLVAEMKVDPARIVFEVTEGVLLENSERTMEILSQVGAMGFRIALDDFGTGYSSLAYLRSFQFDRIKVDRAFVQGIENDLDAQAILKTIVSLGRTLRMKVVAEGVETLVQQQLVQASGCELVQGHLYWRALPLQRAAQLVGSAESEKVRLAS